MHDRLIEILRSHWGYKDFRPLQEDIIRSVIEGRDTLGLMPTGGGKSITFQVPGLLLGGLTVVVTPLISLMKDQVDNLKRHRIQAVFFHSSMTRHENRMAWERLVNGRARFLYIAPERLSNERFVDELRHLDVRLIVVDEAHCISQWGYDFRPAYLNIKVLRKAIPSAPVLALTATATPAVSADICKQLLFDNPAIWRKSFVRENISYLVRHTESKPYEIMHILSHTSGSSIVYVRSRKRCREIAEYLCQSGISATFYHAGLAFEIKEKRQNEWQSGAVRVMVATNAFGMGIDKPDVRVVIHSDLPPSLEEYYQEAGRAGRDGLDSFAVLLASRTDKGVMRRRLSEAFPDREYILRVYERVCNFLHLSVGEGYGMLAQFDIEKFCRTFNLNEKQCRAALRILGHAGYLELVEEANSRSRVTILCERTELYNLQGVTARAERVLAAIMRTYPGLFTDYVNIDEAILSEQLALPMQDIYEDLLLLSRLKVIGYVPRSTIPSIYVMTAREETRHVTIGRAVYEERFKIMEQRIEAMLDYVFGNGGCRVERMLSYFGETDSGDCGRCDICRSNRSAKKPDLNERIAAITAFLKSHPRGSTQQMVESACGRYPDVTARALAFLCNEGYAKCVNSLYTLAD